MVNLPLKRPSQVRIKRFITHKSLYFDALSSKFPYHNLNYQILKKTLPLDDIKIIFKTIHPPPFVDDSGLIDIIDFKNLTKDRQNRA